MDGGFSTPMNDNHNVWVVTFTQHGEEILYSLWGNGEIERIYRPDINEALVKWKRVRVV